MKKDDVLALLHEMPHAIDTNHCMYGRSQRQKLAAAKAAVATGVMSSHRLEGPPAGARTMHATGEVDARAALRPLLLARAH